MSDTGKSYYISVREEMIQRIRLRDQIVLSYIVSVSALTSIVLNISDDSGQIAQDMGVAVTIALIIPFLTLGATVLVTTHSRAINNLGIYCIRELNPAIEKCRKQKYGDSADELKPWESSVQFALNGKRMTLAKTFGYFIIMVMPSIAALYFSYEPFQNPLKHPLKLHSVAWFIGAFFTIMSLYFLSSIYWEITKFTDRLKEKL